MLREQCTKWHSDRASFRINMNNKHTNTIQNSLYTYHTHVTKSFTFHVHFLWSKKKWRKKNPTNKHEQQPKIIHASSNKTIERRLCFDSDHIYSHKCMLLMCYERQLLSQRHSIGCILYTFVNSIHQHNWNQTRLPTIKTSWGGQDVDKIMSFWINFTW